MQTPAYHLLKIFHLLDHFDSTRTPHLLDAIKVSTDALTSLWSRGIFFQDVSEEMTRSQGTGSAQEGCTAAQGRDCLQELHQRAALRRCRYRRDLLYLCP